MKFFTGLFVALAIVAIATASWYFSIRLLDWHIKQVVVADLQEITAPPR